MKIAIVTQTGSDMPLAEAEKLGVTVMPDVVIFGDTAYRNMYDLTADSFYERLKAAEVLPTSSHPSLGDFCEGFRRAAEGADAVLFLGVTSRMSGSFETAVAAAKLLKEEGFKVPIYPYDTLQCSHGMAMLVREACRLAHEGLTCEAIMEQLEVYRHKVGQYFILDTLKYAAKGGRVGAIKALAADKMGIKPLMVFDEGVVRDIALARGFADGLKKVYEKFELEADKTKPVTVFHLEAPERARELADMITAHYPETPITIDYVGPVIGLYAGPGGAGLAFEKA
ncbi:MAG: DegV family protein [Lachnospiraceae bacterium]|nr:DegV family protein [Lachnospiraceae bacterium]